MAWDDQDQQPPWGKKKGPQTPEELIALLLNKIKEFFEGASGAKDKGPAGGGGSAGPNIPGAGLLGGLGRPGMIIGVFFLGYIIFSAFYTIAPGEKGVVLRFGKYVKTTSSGLNFKLPLIDELIKIDVENVRKEEFGFRTKIPGQRTEYAKAGFDNESLMLTSDRNVIDLEWIIQYKVQDPIFFAFKVKDVRQAVRDISEVALRRIVGNMTFDYVLSNREMLAAATQREVQDSLDRYQAGVKIVTVQLQDVNPPEHVKPAFNEVNEADQDMKRLVNEAEEAYNREVPKARGDAKKMLEEAQGYAVERVNLAQGEASRFLAILKEYKGGQDVTRRRMYLETMQEVLPKVSEIYVVDPNKGGLLPFLDVRGGAKGKGTEPK
ncbi:FtsH protease activity modulator HflK [Thiovibrio frasassiensis]|uniref:Protein HflK n=1 Tax=Thiovibrio frasassiensis TaxID=2984131 RepID=A0A9X4MEB4_9BACT|nr:FtsH protease activity modulator HflK [Thiovibrio frasassiensis]MDG4474746.1 FtsH protease activity modulator HflK [Thiovibrio frasassiensis]